MNEADLAAGGFQFVVGGPEVGDQHTLEEIAEEVFQNGGAARAMNEIAGQPLVGETPEPMGHTVDSPAGFIGMEVGARVGLLHDLVIPGREDLREAIPHVDEATGGQREVEVHVEDAHDVRDGHSEAVMKPCSKHESPVSHGGAGQGLGDNGNDLLLARGAVTHILDMTGQLGGLLGDVFGKSLPGLIHQGNRTLAVGAGMKRMFLRSVDIFIADLRSSGTGMSFFAAWLFLPLFPGRGFLVGRLHARGRRGAVRVLRRSSFERVDALLEFLVFVDKLDVVGSQFENRQDGGFFSSGEDFLGLFSIHGRGSDGSVYAADRQRRT